MSKKLRGRTTFDSRHAKSVSSTGEVYRAELLSCFLISLKEVELEKFHLLISEILGLFVNTLTADDKYSLRNSENLPRPFQMHLSKKQKIGNLKSTSNFEHFEKIDELQWLCISEIMD